MRNSLALGVIVFGMLAATGGQARECVPAGQAVSADYARDSPDEWSREALRLNRNEQLVSREQDRLRLVLDGGNTLELVDCPFGDGAYWYLYERYDQAGGFHVVRTQEAEDFSYTLVVMRTGRRFTVHGSPVWASDKSRFLTVACSLEPPRGNLLIQTPKGDGLELEAEFPLPCDAQSCSARWDHESWISVTCTPRGAGGKKGAEFVLMRGINGAWNKFGR